MRTLIGGLDTTRSRVSTRERIDTILARLVALFGFVFTVQSIPAMLGAAKGVGPVWAVVTPTWWIVVIAAAAVCSVLRRGVRVSAGAVAVSFVLMMVLWPLGVPDPAAAEGVQPWIWYVLSLAIAAAAIAVPPFIAGGYALAVAAIYVALRLSPAGGAATPIPVAIETAYSVIIGMFVVVVIGTLRAAASKVDAAQAQAIAHYTVAARQHAVELERTRIDSIVHDRVLASLLAAARASGEEQRAVAVAMASRALDELRELGASDDVASGSDASAAFDAAGTGLSPTADAAPVEPTESGPDLLERLRCLTAARPGVEFDARDVPPGIPARIADALCAATAQAVENSVLHAEPPGAPVLARPVQREVVVTRADGGVRVVVADTGAGFTLADVPLDRLGLRVTVVERMRSVGGEADIASAPGAGTRVALSWRPHGDEEARR
ncbi:sensor histidine kinase [Cnuibacter sp. UC19_7]|uniref:sensor histidine kinase n=1 Tax=Cnuibacter sp. UC19_7 TaxID=3350166 RepID=UPI00366C9B5D